MAHVCSCEHPLNTTYTVERKTESGIVKEETSGLAIPVQVVKENGASESNIQEVEGMNLGVFRAIDDREANKGKAGYQEIEYLVIPYELIDSEEGRAILEYYGIVIPDIEVIEHESLNGIVGLYAGIIWQGPTRDESGKIIDYIKPYDVRAHIVYAGCELSSTIKETNKYTGKEGLQCTEKGIYIVLHPLKEWNEHHEVGIKDGKIVDLKGHEGTDLLQ